MPLPRDPDAARTLDTLAAVQRQLGDAVARLETASVRAGGLARETTWRTDAATRFHENADAWRRELATLCGAVDSANDEVGMLRARIEAYAWRYGV